MPAPAHIRIEDGRHRAALTHYPVRTSPCGWTVGRLSGLRDMAHSFRGDLTEVAAAMGRSRNDCDIALNALLGRTPAQALAALETATPKRPSARRRAA